MKASAVSPDFSRSAAERIIESLRYGVPPVGHIRAFTVGRDDELQRLERSLDGSGALLIRANYGAGKTHLLRIIREMALEAGFAVSLVTVRAQEGVRFNRMDTIFGAVCQEMEVGGDGSKGICNLFDAFADAPPTRVPQELRAVRNRISNGGKWDYSEELKAPALYVALRAWVVGENASVHELIQDWLTHPFNYRSQRTMLYDVLVAQLRNRFRDPRASWQFHADEVFHFHTGGHRQAWGGLADLDSMAKASGLRGLVLLFDEFEDVVQNLNRRDLQQQAFFNLFRFFSGERYPGMAYFAVTPDFVKKCKQELQERGVYDFDFKEFDRLPFFELSRITREQFLVLAQRIRFVHGKAYDWSAEASLPEVALRKLVDDLWATASPDQVRRAIQGVVQALDARLSDSAT